MVKGFGMEMNCNTNGRQGKIEIMKWIEERIEGWWMF